VSTNAKRRLAQKLLKAGKSKVREPPFFTWRELLGIFGAWIAIMAAIVLAGYLVDWYLGT
jgi:hypothetical protein